MKRFLILTFLLSAFAAPSFAGSFQILGSYVQPRADSDIFEQNRIETTFEDNDLNDFGVTVGYDHFLGDFVNLGASISFYNSDSLVEDREFEFANGAPIRRRIELQVVPVELNLRFLPAGRDLAVIPYVGGGVGAYFWEYQEVGDFVFDRFGNPFVEEGRAFSDGTSGGWHVEGGVHIPFSRSAALAAEVKYFDTEGDLDIEGFDPAFEPLDLSQTVISAGVSFWF